MIRRLLQPYTFTTIRVNVCVTFEKSHVPEICVYVFTFSRYIYEYIVWILFQLIRAIETELNVTQPLLINDTTTK